MPGSRWKPPPIEEVTILAPLEIVSARGRAAKVFDFDYVWEVYKPESQRRWGYYTLPVLYGDRLVARFDAKLERSSSTLQIKGFWLEEGQKLDKRFITALKAGMKRFLIFTGGEKLLCSGPGSAEVGEILRSLDQKLSSQINLSSCGSAVSLPCSSSRSHTG